MKRLFSFIFVVILITPLPGSLASGTLAQEHYEKGKKIWETRCPEEGCTLDEVDEALRELKKAIELDPKYVDALVTLGDMLRTYPSRAPKESPKEYYQKASAIAPRRADIYSRLAELALSENNQKEHIELLRKVIELAPNDPRAHGDLAKSLLSQKQLDEAKKEYRIQMEVIPYRSRQDGFDHLNFAGLLAEVGQLDAAVEIYEKLLILIRREPNPRFEACILFNSVDLRRFAIFKEFLGKVERLKPYCTNDGHLRRSVQLEREGKIKEAIEELNLQLKENPYYEETYFILEDIYKRQKQMDKALEVVKKYFEIEKEPSERCKRYMSLSLGYYESIDREFINKLRKECERDKSKDDIR